MTGGSLSHPFPDLADPPQLPYSPTAPQISDCLLLLRNWLRFGCCHMLSTPAPPAIPTALVPKPHLSELSMTQGSFMQT